MKNRRSQSRPAQEIRIVLIHEHPALREGLRLLIDREKHLVVVGEASTCVEAATQVKDGCADVAVLAVDLSRTKSADELVDIFKICPDARVLVMTSAIAPDVCYEAIQHGVSGFFLKDHDPAALIRAIGKIAKGEVWLDRSLMATVLANVRRQESRELSENQKIERLTARERQIVELVCRGLRNRQIASRLFIVEKSVRNHLASIFSKLKVTHRLELSLYAHKNGLFPITGELHTFDLTRTQNSR